MKYYIQYKLTQLVVFFLSLLPLSFLRGCGNLAGNFIYFWMPRRRKIALANLEKAFGNTLTDDAKNDIARAAFQSMALSTIELFITKRIRTNAEERFVIHGNEHLEQAFAKDKGIVLVISHLGSWEYLSFLPYLTQRQWSVIVKDIKNPYLNAYVTRMRQLMTVRPIAKLNSIKKVLKELKHNHGVAILIDQWAGGEGLWLDFFDVGTSTTSIPARLAKRTGAALIPAYCLRQELGKYEIHIHPEVDFDPNDSDWEYRTTEKLNGLLEEQIKKYPDQWLWCHRRWKKKPSELRHL